MTTSLKTESLSLPGIEALLEKAVGKPRVDLLNKFSALTLKDNKNRAEEISYAALELADNLGYRKGKAEAFFGLGDVARTFS